MERNTKKQGWGDALVKILKREKSSRDTCMKLLYILPAALD